MSPISRLDAAMASVLLAVVLTARLSMGIDTGGHSPSFCRQQVLEYANHFQKHSDLRLFGGKPLIDHALPPA
ncbi:hypothetical protein D3C87_1794530 [compost metagenome]